MARAWRGKCAARRAETSSAERPDTKARSNDDDEHARQWRPANLDAAEVMRGLASKVPAITAFFWIAKALTTAMGESASDYLVHRMSPVPAVLTGFLGFCIALAIQFRARRYIAWAYWFAVAMVGVFGTMAADVLHVGLGVPYAISTYCS